MKAAGIVLAGGRSSRMGERKADLEWHGSTLLRRTTGVLAQAGAEPLFVVVAPGQAHPDAGPGVSVVEDAREGLGPLQGLAVGLAAAAGHAPWAFVCATDLPFLQRAFVARVLAAVADDVDVVLPRARGHRQPLAAAYRTSLAPRVEGLVAAGRLRIASLFEACRVAELDEDTLLADGGLAAADPALESVVNVNTPAEYAAARARPVPDAVDGATREGAS